jgi:predicted RNA-binding Zn-ribbon protein involved in translation (DUF1610 family)
MRMQCPECGSVDVHSSRTKSSGESALRWLGIAPRRCSACGWRGLRPRSLFPVGQRSGPQRSSDAAQAIDVREEEAYERARLERRRRRHRNHQRRRKGRTLKAVVYALALGAASGVFAYFFSGE